MTTKPTTMTPDEVFTVIKDSVAAGSSVKDAAESVARQTGRSPASISQTYYNAKRKAQVSTPRRRVGTRGVTSQGRQRANGAGGGGDVTALLGAVSVKVAAMETELAELRAFKARAESILGGKS
jgi:hypothetical protein